VSLVGRSPGGRLTRGGLRHVACSGCCLPARPVDAPRVWRAISPSWRAVPPMRPSSAPVPAGRGLPPTSKSPRSLWEMKYRALRLWGGGLPCRGAVGGVGGPQGGAGVSLLGGGFMHAADHCPATPPAPLAGGHRPHAALPGAVRHVCRGLARARGGGGLGPHQTVLNTPKMTQPRTGSFTPNARPVPSPFRRSSTCAQGRGRGMCISVRVPAGPTGCRAPPEAGSAAPRGPPRPPAGPPGGQV